MTAAVTPPPTITNRRIVQSQQQQIGQLQTNELNTETLIQSAGSEIHPRILALEELESRVAGGSGSGQLDQGRESAAASKNQPLPSKHSQKSIYTSHSPNTSIIGSTITSITSTYSSLTFVMSEQPQSQCFHFDKRGQFLINNSSSSSNQAENMAPVAVAVAVAQSLPTPTTTTAARKPFITNITTAYTPLPTTGICLSHLLLVLMLASSLCLLGGGKQSFRVHCAPVMSAANIAKQQDQQQQQEDALLLLELANRPSNPLESENPLPTNDTPDDIEAILLILEDQPASLPMANPASSSPARKQANRRKRSGISDQRRVELQMRKTLKNIERSKNLAASNLSSGQDATSS